MSWSWNETKPQTQSISRVYSSTIPGTTENFAGHGKFDSKQYSPLIGGPTFKVLLAPVTSETRPMMFNRISRVCMYHPRESSSPIHTFCQDMLANTWLIPNQDYSHNMSGKFRQCPEAGHSSQTLRLPGFTQILRFRGQCRSCQMFQPLDDPVCLAALVTGTWCRERPALKLRGIDT